MEPIQAGELVAYRDKLIEEANSQSLKRVQSRSMGLKYTAHEMRANELYQRAILIDQLVSTLRPDQSFPFLPTDKQQNEVV